MAVRLVHIIAYLFCLPLGLFAQPATVNFHHLSVEEGLPSAHVFDLLQDQKGYMWFATESGISRYDGYAFTNFTVKDGIAKNDVRQILEDRQGRIWILSLGALSLYQNGNFSIQDTFNFIKEARMLTILEGNDGTIWLTSPRHVYYITPDFQAGQIHPGMLEISSNPRLEFVDARGDLWLFGGEGFIVIRNREVLRKVPLEFPVRGRDFTFATCLLKDGSILYASLAGIIAISPDSTQRLIFPVREMENDKISCMIEDQDGKIWIGTRNNGVFSLSWNGDDFVREDQLLPGMDISNIRQDMEGNLWFSTRDQGVWLLSRNAVSAIRTNEGLRSASGGFAALMDAQVSIIESDTEENLWIGTEQGELFQIIGDLRSEVKKEAIPLKNVLGNDIEIRQLLPLQKEGLLIGTNRGIAWKNQGKLTKLYGLPVPTSLRQTCNGDVLVGSLDKFDYRVPVNMLPRLSDPVQAEAAIIELQENGNAEFALETYIYFEDTWNHRWVAWPKGIYRFINGEKIYFDPQETVFRAGVKDIEESSDSLIWIATNGSGLIVVKGDDHREIDKKSGMVSEVCNDIWVNNQNGDVWVATNRGIAKIGDYDFEKNEFPIRWFDIKDGLRSDDVWSLTRHQGLMFAITQAGMVAFDPATIEDDTFQPPIYITRVALPREDLLLKSAYELDSDQDDIRIEFTGISFRNLGRLRFSHKLGDGEWEVSGDPYVHYPSLKAGTYTFTVKALSRDGAESAQPESTTFTIAPVFFRTWWFGAIIVLIAGAVFLGLLKYLYSERQRMVLEERVAEKTYSLNQKVEELHRTNQDLEQFAYVASHDLKTPLRTIIGHLQLLERRYKGSLDEQADEFIVFAVNAAKRMYSMINDLLLYAKVGRNEVPFEPVDFNVVVNHVEESLGGMLQEKEGKITREALPVIQGVSSQWEMLFQNLIVNGLKFNRSEQPEVVIRFKDSPHYWIISVSDNGIGVDEEYQARVFELFQRLHTTEFPGTGLGLAICKRIVEVHGGSIWFESEKDKGTTFFFTIEKP